MVTNEPCYLAGRRRDTRSADLYTARQASYDGVRVLIPVRFQDRAPNNRLLPFADVEAVARELNRSVEPGELTWGVYQVGHARH